MELSVSRDNFTSIFILGQAHRSAGRVACVMNAFKSIFSGDDG